MKYFILPLFLLFFLQDSNAQHLIIPDKENLLFTVKYPDTYKPSEYSDDFTATKESKNCGGELPYCTRFIAKTISADDEWKQLKTNGEIADYMYSLMEGYGIETKKTALTLIEKKNSLGEKYYWLTLVTIPHKMSYTPDAPVILDSLHCKRRCMALFPGTEMLGILDFGFEEKDEKLLLPESVEIVNSFEWKQLPMLAVRQKDYKIKYFWDYSVLVPTDLKAEDENYDDTKAIYRGEGYHMELFSIPFDKKIKRADNVKKFSDEIASKLSVVSDLKRDPVLNNTNAKGLEYYKLTYSGMYNYQNLKLDYYLFFSSDSVAHIISFNITGQYQYGIPSIENTVLNSMELSGILNKEHQTGFKFLMPRDWTYHPKSVSNAIGLYHSKMALADAEPTMMLSYALKSQDKRDILTLKNAGLSELKNILKAYNPNIKSSSMKSPYGDIEILETSYVNPDFKDNRDYDTMIYYIYFQTSKFVGEIKMTSARFSLANNKNIMQKILISIFETN